MKVKKLVMTCALCALSIVPAMAQFSGVSGAKSGSSFPKVFPKSYNRFTVGYNANFLTGDYSGLWVLDGDIDDGMTLNGFALQYTHGFGLSKAHPMYIEVGVKLGMNFYSDSVSDDDVELKETFTGLNLTVPVNFAYRFGVGQDLAVTPYTGLHLKANLLAKGKLSLDDGDEVYDESINMFDKGEVESLVESNGAAWKRVQVGWHIGAGLSYKAFYFGLEYGLDFNELYKKCSTSDLTVSVGLNF